MVSSMLRRNVVFVAGWAVAGLAIAFLVNQFWGDDIAVSQPGASAAPTVVPAMVPPTVVATQTGNASGGAALAEQIPESSATAGAPVHSYATAVRISAPAVVSVYTQTKVVVGVAPQRTITGRTVLVPQEALSPGLGSGVIVDAQGHIVTNAHVLRISDGNREKDVDEIFVQLADGRFAAARVVGRDPGTDLAVLKVDLPRLPVMKLGRSDRLSVGDVVLAIGSPYGLSQTVTQGIVSAMDRSLNGGIARLENFIQTDAAINSGNSGGALVNSRGELVGINTAVLGSDREQRAYGLGVAIPVDLVRGVMQEIVQNGRVVRGWIGIDPPENISEQQVRDLARQWNVQLPHAGVIINNLTPNSPAALAGLARWDMIEAIDGQPVPPRGAQDVYTRIAGRKPGSSVRITVTRNNQILEFNVKVAEQPPPQP